MKVLKNGVIALILSVLAMPMAHSATQKLPFIGSVEVNWLGGNKTVRIITIKKNGTVTIMGENLEGEIFYDYKGKFSNPLKVDYGDGVVDYYKFFGSKRVSLVDSKGRVLKDCLNMAGEEIECTENIEVFK